jgi:EpsI family protein
MEEKSQQQTATVSPAASRTGSVARPQAAPPQTPAEVPARRTIPIKHMVVVLVLLAAGVTFTMTTSKVTQTSKPGVKMVTSHEPFYPEIVYAWKPTLPGVADTIQTTVPFLPEKIGVWQGVDAEVTPAERKILPPDTGFARKFFTNDKGQQVYCSLVLEGKDVSSIHRPEYCLQGQGWKLQGAPHLKITVPGAGGKAFSASQLIGSQEVTVPGQRVKGRQEMVFAYWFVSESSVTGSHGWRILLTTLDRLFRSRNHRWAYFLLAVPVQPPAEGETVADCEQKASAVARQFVQDVYPSVCSVPLNN